ncbi:MAG TPA: zf-HC2 domain-containing protein [Thermodesulfobacteriota bacterium]|nr:zf-HC2 domain-containing protein [Thermodesulfobacteriota bacterium]
MTNSCSAVSKVLEKYFDQEVTGEERFLVEGHLQDCPACRDALKSMEELRTWMRVPVDEAVRKEDFPWVWQKIERGIRLQEQRSWWQSLRSWLDVTPLFRKKVWIPAVATIVVLLFISTQIIFKQTPSYQGASVVEYLESPTCNVMVYQLEEPKVTVIWMFEGPEEEHTTT